MDTMDGTTLQRHLWYGTNKEFIMKRICRYRLVVVHKMAVTPYDNLTSGCVETPCGAQLQDITCTAVLEYAPSFTYVLCLSNLENLNVQQHGLSATTLTISHLNKIIGIGTTQQKIRVVT